MSRTRHHQDTTLSSAKRKQRSLKQRYVEALRLDDWYIELPISKKIPTNLVDRRKAWN